MRVRAVRGLVVAHNATLSDPEALQEGFHIAIRQEPAPHSLCLFNNLKISI
jgi:hypothetical protein